MSDLTVYEFLTELDGITGVDGNARPQLVWVDIETTGLEESDVILEFGMCVTDFNGVVIPNSVTQTVVREKTEHYNDRLAQMDDFVMKMHSDSGLLDELDLPDVSNARTCQSMAIQTLRQCTVLAPKTGMLAGSSVHFDGEKLNRYMPRFMDYLHYRQVNVSSLKELCKAFNPRVYRELPNYARNEKRHRVLSDLVDSISEYKYYIDNFLWTAENV